MLIDRARVAAALPAYELGAELGSGAFGLVLAGRHRSLDRPVAIKVLSAAHDGAAADFASEARLLAGINHPHVVQVHDYVEADGLCLIVMELLAGGTLTRRRRLLPPEGACAVGLAVAAALSHAHGKGVLHRDIKSDNILFDADGLLKVTDFGIAKIFQGSAATASAVLGTPAYMAPEQVLGGRLGPSTDLYALAVVLYQLLSGSLPFDPRLPLRVLWQHHIETVPAAPAGAPAPVAGVVMRALAKDPAARHPSAEAFALDLARAATLSYGARWTGRSGVLLRLDDAVRDASDLPPDISSRPAADPPPRPSPAPPPPEAEPTSGGLSSERSTRIVDQPDTRPPASLPAAQGGSGSREAGPVRRRRRQVLAGATALLLAAGGLFAATTIPTDGHPDDDSGGSALSPGVASTTYTIGFQGPLSGDNQQLGTNARNGVRTAVDEANKEGDLPFVLRLVESDDQGDPAEGPAAAQALIDESSVLAVVGPVFSGATMASEPSFSEAGLLSVSPSATYPGLTSAGFTSFFRALASDTVQATAVADYIARVLAPGTVFSLDDRSAYGTGLSTVLESRLQDNGVAVTHDGLAPTKDYTAEADKIIAARPDMLFYSGYYAELALLTRALRSRGFTGAIMSGDGSLDPQFVAQAGADADGVYLSCSCGDVNADPKAAAFVSSYRALNAGARPGTYSAEAYDVTRAVISVLRKLGTGATRASVAAAFRTVDSPGLTKTIRFQPNGEIEGAGAFIYQVRSGAITVVGNTADLPRS